jgi:putative transcriptional regulator
MEDTVRNRVRECRESLGLTQGELAQAAKVSRQSINSIERGRYTPSLPLALRFAMIFECSVDELFTLEEIGK